jgi:hypothetical protein
MVLGALEDVAQMLVHYVMRAQVDTTAEYLHAA